MPQSRIGEWTKLALFGQAMPGVIVSEPVRHVATTATGKNIPTYRAEVITLRETNPANGPVRKVYRKTDEDLGFAYPRTKPVIGLDVDENGVVIDLDTLSDLAMADTLAFQSERIAAQAEPEVDF